MNRIVLLNGPPQSGKDTVATYLLHQYGYHHLKFADPLRQAASLVFNVRDGEIESWKTRKIGKDKVGRDFMIGLSENFIKPLLGDDWFGIRAARRVLSLIGESDCPQDFVISDCGFKAEVEAFITHLSQRLIDPTSIQMWHIHRDGCTFDGDSRDWVFLKTLPPHILYNNSTLTDLRDEIEEIMASQRGVIVNKQLLAA